MRPPDYFDMADAEEQGYDVDQRRLQCNRCGSTAVRWRQQGGNWVLFSLQAGVEHQCVQAAPASDFD